MNFIHHGHTEIVKCADQMVQASTISVNYVWANVDVCHARGCCESEELCEVSFFLIEKMHFKS